MKNKNNIPENPLENAPFLSKIKKENHFSTPNNYFESLPEITNSNLLNNSSLKFSFDKLSYRILVPITSLIVILIVVFNLNDNNSEIEITPDQLSELIIDEEYLEIDDYLVYETYAEIIEEDAEETTETEEYINYLIDNDIDINSIIEEL
jgi:hypothetical protein